MDAKKVRSVIQIYRLQLWNMGIPEKKIPPQISIGFVRAFFFQGWILGHVHAMLDEMEGFIRENRMDKTFRWLGFIQGTLWVSGVFTLEELKTHNRRDS